MEFFLGFTVLIVVIIVVTIVATHIYEKKRTEALRKVADELNFEFLPAGEARLTSALSAFHLFNIGRGRRMSNLLRGRAGGIELNIFDYRYTTGSGKSQRTWNETVFAARCQEMDLPQFSMRPETVWSKIGTWFGFKDIDFDSHPTFSRTYYLKGADEEEIRKIFRPEVLEYFEAHAGLNVEGLGDVILYHTTKRRKPEQIRAFMTDGFAILKLFQPGGESAAAGE